jgi:hypothetical protein
MDLRDWPWPIDGEFCCPKIQSWRDIFQTGTGRCKEGKYQITEWLDELLSERIAFFSVESYRGLFLGNESVGAQDRRLQVHARSSANGKALLGFVFEEAVGCLYPIAIWCSSDGFDATQLKAIVRQSLVASAWTLSEE